MALIQADAVEGPEQCGASGRGVATVCGRGAQRVRSGGECLVGAPLVATRQDAVLKADLQPRLVLSGNLSGDVCLLSSSRHEGGFRKPQCRGPPPVGHEGAAVLTTGTDGMASLGVPQQMVAYLGVPQQMVQHQKKQMVAYLNRWCTSQKEQTVAHLSSARPVSYTHLTLPTKA